MSNHYTGNDRFGYRAAAWLLAVLFFSVVSLLGTASAEEGKWSVSLAPSVVPFLSGDAGSGKGAPKYSDAFDTGYGITLEVEKALSPQAGIHGGIGFEHHSGKDYKGVSFDDLDMVPVYVGGTYRFPVGRAVGLYLNADVGAMHFSSVDISSDGLSGRYWNASWVFLFDAGAGLEYRTGSPWSASLETDFRYLGKPDSILGTASDAGSSWTLPIRFAVRYSF
ncbi:MAG: outer membrane beta-barrel protein [Candidatus Sulfobium sp.]|jgi:opacity protein-like surface antigen